MSNQPSKHRELILAFAENQLQERCQFNEGFNAWNADIQHILESDLGDILCFQQRFFLEQCDGWRQPLPYMLFSRLDAEGNKTYFTYRRTPLSGESRLFMDHSIGPGGHVDIGDVRIFENDEFDYTATIKANMVREAMEELRWFVNTELNDGASFFEDDLAVLFESAIPLGWLYDNSNEVGKHHLGIVYEIVLPPELYVEIKENQNIFKGYKTMEQLKAEVASGVSYESWSKLLIEALA